MSGHKITDHPSLWTILGALRCVLCPPRARLTHGVDIVGFNSTREAAKKARNEK